MGRVGELGSPIRGGSGRLLPQSLDWQSGGSRIVFSIVPPRSLIRVRLLAKPARRVTVIGAAGAALLCASMPVGGASARVRQSCAGLKGKHLASTRKLKVTERGNENKGTAYACALPNGPVRVAAQASSLTGNSEYSIRVAAVAGSWVALSLFNGDGIGGEETGKAFDVANGHSYRYWRYESSPTAKPEEVRALDAVRLSATGQIAIAEHEGDTEQIVGFEPSGARRVLDTGPRAQIPPKSLVLQGRMVRWVDSGATRTASL